MSDDKVVTFPKPPSAEETATNFAAYCWTTYSAFKAAGFDDERSYDMLCRILDKWEPQ